MEISITRALSQLTLLDKRIHKSIGEMKYVAHAKINSDKVLVAHTRESFTSSQQAKYQSVTDLISLRKEIKSKIVQSNAATIVTIGDQKYTVADAIERKNSIEYDKRLLSYMKERLSSVQATISRSNESVEEKALDLLKTLAGKDAKNLKIEEHSLAKTYLEENSYELIDPLGLADIIETLDREIDLFESNVDYVLSESNAITKITISKAPELI